MSSPHSDQGHARRVRNFLRGRTQSPADEQPAATTARTVTTPRQQAAESVHGLLHPTAIATIEDLDLIARFVVEGFMHGLHASPYVGFSLEFASHREYLPGDDLRHLNWKLFGRHDRLYVKQFDAETNLELHLVVDVSGSMQGSPVEALRADSNSQHTVTKARYAGMLAACIAHLAHTQRDAVGLTVFADRVQHSIRPRSSQDHLLEILQTIAGVTDHPRCESAHILHEVAELMPRRGLICLLTDAYYDTEELLSALNHFRHFGHDVIVFQILDSIEYRMDIQGSVRFRDQETGETILTQAQDIRDQYVRAIQTWVEQLHNGCMSRDIDHFLAITDTPLEHCLMDYFIKRSQLY